MLDGPLIESSHGEPQPLERSYGVAGDEIRPSEAGSNRECLLHGEHDTINVHNPSTVAFWLRPHSNGSAPRWH